MAGFDQLKCVKMRLPTTVVLLVLYPWNVWYRAWNVTYVMAWSQVVSCVFLKGLGPVLEGFVVTMHEGACETQARVHCDNKPRQISLNHDYNVWYFQFHPVNVSILHLKDDYRAQSESRFACYSHCYVTWCPLTTGIVASQCPSARDAVLETRYITPFISTCLNSFLRFIPQENIFTKDLLT